MVSFRFLLCLSATVLSVAHQVASLPNHKDIYWTHHANFPAGFHLKWTNADPEWIVMEMSAPTKGYIGIGFSRTGGMAGADIALGWVDDNGRAWFKVSLE